MGAQFERTLRSDTQPIPVVGYNRSKRQSDFEGSASYGWCASRKLHDFGYKLVVVSMLSGVPLVYSPYRRGNLDPRAEGRKSNLEPVSGGL